MKNNDFNLLLRQIAEAPSVAPKAQFSGTQRFKIIRRLGAGGFGVVYEAFDRQTETRIALKTLHQMGPHAIQRLKNEFRSLQNLVHPNLCSLGDLIEDGGEWFFTMELLQGTDFVSYCRPSDAGKAQTSSFDEQKLRTAVWQLSLALATLHETGKVHRDIKPSNVFVTFDHRTVVLDFGLVTELKSPNGNHDSHTGGTIFKG